MRKAAAINRVQKPPPKIAAEKLPPIAPAKTPVEVLIELGRALHGEHWIGPTARDLNMRHDTVTKWVSGKRSPPGPILDALRLLVKSHTQAVARAREISGKGKL